MEDTDPHRPRLFCVCVNAPPLCVRSYLSVSGWGRGGVVGVSVCTCVSSVASHPDARGSAAIRGGKMEPWKDGPHLLTDLIFLPPPPPPPVSFHLRNTFAQKKIAASYEEVRRPPLPHPTPATPLRVNTGTIVRRCDGSPVPSRRMASPPDIGDRESRKNPQNSISGLR